MSDKIKKVILIYLLIEYIFLRSKEMEKLLSKYLMKILFFRNSILSNSDEEAFSDFDKKEVEDSSKSSNFDDSSNDSTSSSDSLFVQVRKLDRMILINMLRCNHTIWYAGISDSSHRSKIESIEMEPFIELFLLN